MCPFPDGRGRFGRISAAPVRPHQGPAKLGLTMSSCVRPGRGRPAACIEDHQTGLADNLPVGSRGLDNERPSPSVLQPPIPSSMVAHVVELRDRFSVRAVHDHRIREQLVNGRRIFQSWHSRQSLFAADADLLQGRILCVEPRPDRRRSLSHQLSMFARFFTRRALVAHWNPSHASHRGFPRSPSSRPAVGRLVAPRVAHQRLGSAAARSLQARPPEFARCSSSQACRRRSLYYAYPRPR